MHRLLSSVTLISILFECLENGYHQESHFNSRSGTKFIGILVNSNLRVQKNKMISLLSDRILIELKQITVTAFQY
ncbi:hypothetical protein AABM17_1336 [Neisseria musculi]|uniref:Uncharacterized protein n=1 Tax=Neisseria musculi TaxID=1815583 RepID=A0A7H1M9C5_9NEIS|nr:hypothetical protein H7A79_1336 [Neisseria musculi]